MRKPIFIFVFALALGTGLATIGCAEQQESAKEVINESEALESTEDQVEYLIQEAEAFLEEDLYAEARSVAEHVLDNLDSASKEAQDIVKKASSKMQETMQNELGM